jgi:hypothetical protein
VIAPFMLGWLVGVTTLPPVRIDSCRISTPSVIPASSDGGTMVTGGYSLRIRFVDTASQTISRVTFRLNDGTSVIDVGTFSPSIAIDHTFDLPQTEATSCEVTSVTFADGELWNAGG